MERHAFPDIAIDNGKSPQYRLGEAMNESSILVTGIPHPAKISNVLPHKDLRREGTGSEYRIGDSSILFNQAIR